MDEFHPHREPIIVIASEEFIAIQWAHQHLNSFARKPICKSLLQADTVLRGIRGKVIVLVDIPDMAVNSYRGNYNTIITLNP
jgi:hypothetical protein